MILTCPECATRYFVPDEKMGADGRTVKCANCGHRWHASAKPDLELFEDDDLGALAREVQGAAGETDDKPPEDLSEVPGAELPKVIRQRKDTERKVREAAAVGVVWAGMAAGLAVMVAAAVVFRGTVVDLWPKSAAAYASVGLPVNRVGLTLEQVRAEPTLREGHAALQVTGLMRNIEDRSVEAPPLAVVLMASDGRRVGGKIAQAQDPTIPSGGTRRFTVVLLDPPSNARTLEVGFVYEGGGKPAKAAVQLGTPAASQALRPPSAAAAAPAADAGLRGASPDPVSPPPAAAPASPSSADPAESSPHG